MKPENKDNMRRLLWLFLLCLLAFGTGYYTARETNPKPISYPAYVDQSSSDSLVHIIDSLKVRVQKIPEYRVKEKVVTVTVYEQTLQKSWMPYSNSYSITYRTFQTEQKQIE